MKKNKQIKCEYCNSLFEVPRTRENNARKYCSIDCMNKAYKEKRKLSDRKYRNKQKNKQKKLIIKKCKWCGKPYIRFDNRGCYCSELCRKYAVLEQNLRSVRKYQRSYYFSEFQAWLGNSNLKAKPRNNFDEELSAVEAEMRRLKLK